MWPRPSFPILIGVVMGALLACSSEDTVDEQQLREDVLRIRSRPYAAS